MTTLAIGNAHPVIFDVVTEINSAMKKHGPLSSLHESYAVIKEELDEAWDEIKVRERDIVKVRGELIQVAAMAIRAIIDCVDGESTYDEAFWRMARRVAQQRVSGL